MNHTTATTAPAGQARQLAGYLNGDHGGVQVDARHPTGEDGPVVFMLGHECDVARDGDRWTVREHDTGPCHGCVTCDLCGGVTRRPPGTSIWDLPAGMTEIRLCDTKVIMCGGCAGKPVSEAVKAAERVRASRPNEAPWADEF